MLRFNLSMDLIDHNIYHEWFNLLTEKSKSHTVFVEIITVLISWFYHIILWSHGPNENITKNIVVKSSECGNYTLVVYYDS